MYRFLFFVVFLVSHSAIADNQTNWFVYDAQTQTYSIDSQNIIPRHLFRNISKYSGIHIRFDDTLTKPIEFYGKNIKQDRIIAFLEKQYSTLQTFTKNDQGQDVLTTLTILPKGKFQSDHLVAAINPPNDNTLDNNSETENTPKPSLPSRLNALRDRMKAHANGDQKTNSTLKERKENKRKRREEALEKLKQTHPDLYEKRKHLFEFGAQPK